jgi:hypothetical protein
MSDTYKKLQEISEDIFNMTVLLKEYCKINKTTQETECIYACVKALNKRADDLMFNVKDICNIAYDVQTD